MLRLSQGQLTLLEYCPRRYQYTILESLAVPASPELLEAQQWGDLFHLLMQQREMGLPIDPVLQADTPLQNCLTQLQTSAPQLFDKTGEIFRQSEHERSLMLQGYWFTVVYDLVRGWRERAEIVDWKTYLRPHSANTLQQEWQTRLYLYVLAETSNYAPEQITMTYWFVRAEDPETQSPKPSQVQISYSAARHRQTQQQLTHLTQRLTALLDVGLPLPQLPLDSVKCQDCPFAIRCQRGPAAFESWQTLPRLDEIAEMPI